MTQKELSYSARLVANRKKRENSPWIVAAGGSETPFIARSGARLIYVFQPDTGKHAYLNLDNDNILSDKEAEMHLDRYTRGGSRATPYSNLGK
jgi:hypothetical protein